MRIDGDADERLANVLQINLNMSRLSPEEGLVAATTEMLEERHGMTLAWPAENGQS
jgi:hypothetical protein